MKKALGRHILLELFHCNVETLKDEELVRDILVRSAQSAKANIVDTFFHQFSPHGVSGVVVIEESHFTIHTWPEHAFAAIDLFFCSDLVEIDKAIDILIKEFAPENIGIVEIKRGILPSKKEETTYPAVKRKMAVNVPL